MRFVSKFLLITIAPLFGIGTHFLSLPTTVDHLSIGTHPTLQNFNSTNPALYMASIHQPDFSINRGEWFGDVSTTQLTYNQSLKHNVFHVGLRYASLSGLEFRENRPQDDPSAHFSAYGLAMDAGFSFQKKKTKLGVSLSAVQMGIYSESSFGMGLNVGVVKSLKQGLSLGLVLKNMGWMSTLENTSPKLPMTFEGGVAKKIIFNDYSNQIHGSFAQDHISKQWVLALGNEFKWQRLRIMGGFSTSNDVVETSTGFGIQALGMNFSYGARFGSQQLGTPQIFTIHMKLP